MVKGDISNVTLFGPSCHHNTYLTDFMSPNIVSIARKRLQSGEEQAKTRISEIAFCSFATFPLFTR